MKNSLFMGYNGLFNVGFGSMIDKYYCIEFGVKIFFLKIRNFFKNFYFLDSVFIYVVYSYVF